MMKNLSVFIRSVVKGSKMVILLINASALDLTRAKKTQTACRRSEWKEDGA